MEIERKQRAKDGLVAIQASGVTVAHPTPPHHTTHISLRTTNKATLLCHSNCNFDIPSARGNASRLIGTAVSEQALHSLLCAGQVGTLHRPLAGSLMTLTFVTAEVTQGGLSDE